MLLAEVPSILVDVGTAAGAVTAVLVLLALVGKSRLGKWVWRTMVSRPSGDWLTAHVGAVVAPVAVKVDALDGKVSQLSDRDTALAQALLDHMANEEARLKGAALALAADVALREQRQAELGEWQVEMGTRLDAGDVRFDRIEGKLDDALRERG